VRFVGSACEELVEIEALAELQGYSEATVLSRYGTISRDSGIQRSMLASPARLILYVILTALLGGH